MRQAAPHGTRSGYARHLRKGTVPCAWCLRANADEARKSRERHLCARGLGWPLAARRG